ncbi:hypothetical protein D3OALGA1CA_5904 [Olavius algarvensis associated proteobacterium Delta 3]|nr:hypothetical protein D3OALGA1CA_5904 [Olavius algarvensis associated proteobacterium Delta 3]
MKSFQQLAKKKKNRGVTVNVGLFRENAICHVQDLQNSLKRFHPLGQTETLMAGVIRGSR